MHFLPLSPLQPVSFLLLTIYVTGLKPLSEGLTDTQITMVKSRYFSFLEVKVKLAPCSMYFMV